jgi:hypothetical protein
VGRQSEATASEAAEKVASRDSVGRQPEATASEAAEKVASRDVLKGHGFSRAAQVLSFWHPKATLVAEGSTFSTFSATSSAVGKLG